MNPNLYATGSTVRSTTFKASDGKLFLTRKELSEYLRSQNLDALLSYESVGSGGEWSCDMFKQFLLDNRKDVIEVLGGQDIDWTEAAEPT